MSFYQPSFSPYDLLFALANQGRGGFPPEDANPRQRPAPGPAHHHHQHQHQHGHHHGSNHPSFGRYQSDDPFQAMFGGQGSFSRSPQQGHYYNPQYGYQEEEEGAKEDDEMDVEPAQSEEPQQDFPSYYHDESGRFNRNVQQPSLNDFLSALVGGNVPGFVGRPQKEEAPKAAPKKTTQEPEVVAEEVPEKPNEQPVSGPENPVPEAAKPVKAPVSFAHLQGPSPIPDPLQISKPEIRLDLPFSPEVNVYDLEKEYVVVLALPGANSKAFKIDYHPSSHELLIKGNITDRLGIDEKFLKITEVKYGAFERTVKFPVLPRIKDEQIKASYSNGLLQIKVPKLEGQEKPAPKKRISIEDVPDAELEFERNPNPIEK